MSNAHNIAFEPMLDRYVSERMVSRIKSNNEINEPINGYQHCNTNQVLILVGIFKMIKYVDNQVIIWVNTTILNSIDTKGNFTKV